MKRRKDTSRAIWFSFVAIGTVALSAAPSGADQPDYRARAEERCELCVDRLPGSLRECTELVDGRRAFGDVLVTLMPTPGTHSENDEYATGRPMVSATASLGNDVASCVEDRLRRTKCLSACYSVGRDPIDVPMGTPQPLLPPIRDLLSSWRAYQDSSWPTRAWSRWRLARSLSSDVRITPEKCLWVPQVTNLHAGLDAWESQLGEEMPRGSLAKFASAPTKGRWHADWDHGHQTSGYAILVDEGPPADASTEWREYDGTAGILVCLVPVASSR